MRTIRCDHLRKEQQVLEQLQLNESNRTRSIKSKDTNTCKEMLQLAFIMTTHCCAVCIVPATSK